MTVQGQEVAGIGLFLAAYVDERGADKALESIKQAPRRRLTVRVGLRSQASWFGAAVDQPTITTNLNGEHHGS